MSDDDATSTVQIVTARPPAAGAANELAHARALNAIALAASGEADLDRLLDAALGNLAGIIAFTGGSIALVEDDALVVRSARGPHAAGARGQRLPRGRGRLWRVVEACEPFVTGDLLRDGVRPVDAAAPLRSYLAVPLRWRDAPCGVLEIDSVHPDVFTEHDLELLLRVGQVLGGPVELARQRDAERTARLQLEAMAAQLQGQAAELEMQMTELEAANDALLLAQREAEAARAAAEAANRAKAEFLAMMSHELRTPLNAIGGYAELLELGIRGPVNDAQRADLGRVRRSQAHLLRLINNILGFAKLEAGRVEFDPRDFGVAALLAGLDDLVAPQAAAGRIAYQRDEPPPTLHAYADPAKVEQILLNLVSNALKFTPPGGTIRLSAAAEEGAAQESATVVVRVRDTGGGIPAERQATVFEPFVQVGPALTRTAEGTGLGLSIARELARAMGGDLLLEQSTPEGSIFALRLPAGGSAG